MLTYVTNILSFNVSFWELAKDDGGFTGTKHIIILLLKKKKVLLL